MQIIDYTSFPAGCGTPPSWQGSSSISAAGGVLVLPRDSSAEAVSTHYQPASDTHTVVTRLPDGTMQAIADPRPALFSTKHSIIDTPPSSKPSPEPL